MLPNELIEQVKALDEDDSTQLLQLLKGGLAAGDLTFEIATPYDNEAAAEILRQALLAAEQREAEG